MKRDHMMGFQQAAEGANVDPLNWWCANEFPLGVPKNRAIVGLNAGHPEDIARCEADDKARAFEQGDHPPDYMKKSEPPKEYIVTFPAGDSVLIGLRGSFHSDIITISASARGANYEDSISQMRREPEAWRRELRLAYAINLPAHL